MKDSLYVRLSRGSQRRVICGASVLVAVLLVVLAAGSVGVRSASASPTPSGTVVAWGHDLYGDTSVPTGLDHVTAVAAGNTHSLALKNDGTVVAWGGNFSGQTNVPSGLDHVVAVSAGGTFSVALKEDGTVVTWGGFFDMTPPAGLDHVVAIAAGGARVFALKDNGTVVAWGWDAYVPDGLVDVVAIAAADDHALALKANGTVVGWGGNSSGEVSVPSGLNNVTRIATGWRHSIALKADGTVVAWGANSVGQTNVPVGLDHVTAIAAGGQASLALRDNGQVVAWGWNYYGQTTIPAGLSATAIAVGDYHSLAVQAALDTTPPEIASPGDQTVPATSPAGAIATWTITATDDVDGSVPVACTPDSGSTFAIGDTAVECTATDSAGNIATANFRVHVQGAAEQLANLNSVATGVGPGTSLADKVQNADIALATNDVPNTCSILRAFINEVIAQSGQHIPTDTAASLITDAARITVVLGC